MTPKNKTKERLIEDIKLLQKRITELEAVDTERKRAEEERKNILEQLFRVEKLAAIGELTAGVAHEINNPLTGMLGLSDLLLRKIMKILTKIRKKLFGLSMNPASVSKR